MKSTGEVMGIDTFVRECFSKAELAAATDLPLTGRIFISVRDSDKLSARPVARGLRRWLSVGRNRWDRAAISIDSVSPALRSKSR